jgi:hypothetical protein
MASKRVTGRTREQIEGLRLRHEYLDRDKDFEEQYCLSPIPRQPDDYQGPDRFCVNQGYISKIGSEYRCKYHGGDGTTEHLDKLANMKHGLRAEDDSLMEDFSEKDETLYQWITEEWPESYDIDTSTDPQAAYDFHRLALAVVRAERGRGYVIEEGEVHEEEKVSEEGALVVGSDGEVVTEKSEHYLSNMLNRQDNKITKIEKELGITRKERDRSSKQDDAIDAMKGFEALGQKFLGREEKSYDPDDEPWSDEGEDDGG